MKSRSLWRKRKDVMKFNDKEAESKARQEAALQALHDENVRLGLYEGVYAIDVLEQENRLLRARNDRLEKELAMYQVQRLGQEIQPERDYERGFIDGMQKQAQSSVDKAVNRLAQPEQEPVALVIDGVLVKSELPEKYTGHLYTTPPQRKPLKFEEMWVLWNSQGDDAMEQQAAIAFARAIEAAHGIKE